MFRSFNKERNVADNPDVIRQALGGLVKQISEIRQDVAGHDKQLRDMDKDSGGGDLKALKASITALEKRVGEIEKKVKK